MQVAADPPAFLLPCGQDALTRAPQIGGHPHRVRRVRGVGGERGQHPVVCESEPARSPRADEEAAHQLAVPDERDPPGIGADVAALQTAGQPVGDLHGHAGDAQIVAECGDHGRQRLGRSRLAQPVDEPFGEEPGIARAAVRRALRPPPQRTPQAGEETAGQPGGQHAHEPGGAGADQVETGDRRGGRSGDEHAGRCGRDGRRRQVDHC
ncbi:hypothetical protein [Microbispora sp. NBRC 16548]|uniref:hypothetical protein n=1 Tax=Microbispora sp. NBRC 16548 TaxID=3030994 RepID=UPI0024A49F7E|nr:hypothetical protein [Microbispora sp. NBRC 16548]GLX04163.1 hypothetical protein Misp03_10900 [Microbispora sp. NBRC 16548]